MEVKRIRTVRILNLFIFRFMKVRSSWSSGYRSGARGVEVPTLREVTRSCYMYREARWVAATCNTSWQIRSQIRLENKACYPFPSRWKCRLAKRGLLLPACSKKIYSTTVTYLDWQIRFCGRSSAILKKRRELQGCIGSNSSFKRT